MKDGTEFDIVKAAEIAKHWEHYEGVWELGCLGCFEQLTALASSPAPDAGLRAALLEILRAVEAAEHSAEYWVRADRVRRIGDLLRVALAALAPAGLRFDHDGTWRHHHDADTAEPVWWGNVEQFGGEKRHHIHRHASAPAPAGLATALRSFLNNVEHWRTDEELLEAWDHYSRAATRPAKDAGLDREALWAMWTAGEKLAYGCGYRDGAATGPAEDSHE
jgi:hypothetical protein